jgi:hypothetical protein
MTSDLYVSPLNSARSLPKFINEIDCPTILVTSDTRLRLCRPLAVAPVVVLRLNSYNPLDVCRFGLPVDKGG